MPKGRGFTPLSVKTGPSPLGQALGGCQEVEKQQENDGIQADEKQQVQHQVQHRRDSVQAVDGPGRHAVQRQAQNAQGQQAVKRRGTQLFLIPPPLPDVEKRDIGNDQQTAGLELAVFRVLALLL